MEILKPVSAGQFSYMNVTNKGCGPQLQLNEREESPPKCYTEECFFK